MKQTVYKYPLQCCNEDVVMPRGAKILHVHAQNERVTLWALIDPHEQETETRRFWAVTTGEEIPYRPSAYVLEPLGTVHLHNGTYVLHVFEVYHPGVSIAGERA